MVNAKADTREARLKAALRENLKRRKAQARGREDADRESDALGNGGSAPPKGRPE